MWVGSFKAFHSGSRAGNQWDRNVTEDELEVQKTIKSREQEIWRLENENARLRLRLNTEDKDNDDDQGSCGNGERNRQKALHSVILPEIRKIIKDYDGGEEEWEEMERRHHVWKDWTPDPKDLHTLHLFSGIHPDDHEEVSYRWRKDGMLTMKRQIEVLLEADQWKRGRDGPTQLVAINCLISCNGEQKRQGDFSSINLLQEEKGTTKG